jgi:3',5'-cyclic AMP phosphodiesterase CpdA
MDRRKFLKQSGVIGAAAFLGALPGCDLPFEYSQYDVKVKHRYRHLTEKNLDKLAALDKGEGKFKFAFITDTHTFYDDLTDVIPVINARDDVDFVIHGGDITLSALHKEYTWFNEIMDDLDKPFLTVLGNHDFLSNGEEIYNLSFGPNNYVFNFNGCKFVMFDNTIWERKNTLPDFDWLEENLKPTGENMILPVSHLPPWSDQYNEENEKRFNEIFERNNIPFSIHGHTHSYYNGKRYDNVEYMVGGDIADRHYQVITIDGDKYSIEDVEF